MSSKKTPVEAARAYKSILAAIERIEEFISGYTEDRFAADEKTISATCYQIVTIGERIYDLYKGRYFDMSPFNDRIDWDKIGRMRHFLAHEYYDSIDAELLWATLKNHMPVLKEAITWHLKALD